MKKKELFDALREIDPSYILDAAPKEKIRYVHFPAVLAKWGALAACLIVLLCAVPVVKRLMNGSVPGVIPPDTVPGTDVVENPDFIIENGVLLNYVGDDPHVVVPDEVIEISRDAFAEKGDIIDTITIGKNVEVVDYLFLSHVDHLSGVVVEEENPKFEIYEGVFVEKEDIYLIDTSGDLQKDFSRFIEVGKEIRNGLLEVSNTAKFVIGNAVITITAEEILGADQKWYNGIIQEIEFCGNAFPLPQNSYNQLSGNSSVLLYQTKDYLLYSNTSNTWLGTTYFISKNDVWDYSTGRNPKPMDNILHIELSEKGELQYVITPWTFAPCFDQWSAMDQLKCCTDWNDFWKEVGIVTFSEEGVHFNAVQRYSINDPQKSEELNRLFAMAKELNYEVAQGFSSIDDLFLYNKNTDCNWDSFRE